MRTPTSTSFPAATKAVAPFGIADSSSQPPKHPAATSTIAEARAGRSPRAICTATTTSRTRSKTSAGVIESVVPPALTATLGWFGARMRVTATVSRKSA